MEELSKILRVATAAIELPYFNLSIQGAEPVFRERVYCYELYHQMRMNWPTGTEFLLTGEIDKRAHPILRELGADRTIPDLLVHIPGNMKGNHAIIEVKCSTDKRGIRKDINTLNLFVQKVGYERAIYLIYGDEAEADSIGNIRAVANEIKELCPIELWLHHQVGGAATYYTTLQRTDQITA